MKAKKLRAVKNLKTVKKRSGKMNYPEKYWNARNMSEELAAQAIKDIGRGGILEIALDDANIKKADLSRDCGANDTGQMVSGWIKRNGVPPKKAQMVADLIGINPHYISEFDDVKSGDESRYPALKVGFELNEKLKSSAALRDYSVEKEILQRLELSYSQEEKLATLDELSNLHRQHIIELRRTKALMLVAAKDLVEQIEEEHKAIEDISGGMEGIAESAISALRVAVDRVEIEVSRMQGHIYDIDR